MEDQRQKTRKERAGSSFESGEEVVQSGLGPVLPRPDDHCHLGPPRSSCGCGGPSPLPRATRYAPRSACSRFLTCQPAAALQHPAALKGVPQAKASVATKQPGSSPPPAVPVDTATSFGFGVR